MFDIKNPCQRDNSPGTYDGSVQYCIYSHGRAGQQAGGLVTGGQSLASGNNGGICIATTAHD